MNTGGMKSERGGDRGTMKTCCGAEAAKKAVLYERAWPWGLLPGGEDKWLPVTYIQSALVLVWQIPVEKARAAITYDHRFNWWQTGRTGVPPDSSVELDSAAARRAIPGLQPGMHPAVLVCGPQTDPNGRKVSELRYLIPFCTNAACADAGCPNLVDVLWTYRVTAMADSLLHCVAHWSRSRLPCAQPVSRYSLRRPRPAHPLHRPDLAHACRCTHARFAFEPDLVKDVAHEGLSASVLPTSGGISISIQKTGDPSQAFRLSAAPEEEELSYEQAQQRLDWDLLATLEQPYFSEPSLESWGAFNLDLDRAAFRFISPNSLRVQGMPVTLLPEIVDSSGGLNRWLVGALAVAVPMKESTTLGRSQLSLLEAVGLLKKGEPVEVSELLPTSHGLAHCVS